MRQLKNILKFIFIYGCFYFCTFIILFLLKEYGIDIKKLTLKENTLVMIFSDILMVSLLIVIYHKYLWEKLKDFKQNFFKYLKIAFKGWGLGLIIMMISSTIIYNFSPVKQPVNEVYIQELLDKVPFYTFLLTSFFAPFIEEMIFRKSLQDCCSNSLRFIIISGLIFGYAHVSESKTIFEFIHIIPYGGLGCCFAYVLAKTNNIYSTISIHFLHNFILTLISII